MLLAPSAVRRLAVERNNHEITIRRGVSVKTITVAVIGIIVPASADLKPEITICRIDCNVITEKVGK